MEAASAAIHSEALFEAGKERPNAVRTIEEMVVAKQAKKQSKKAAHDGARSMVDATTSWQATPLGSLFS